MAKQTTKQTIKSEPIYALYFNGLNHGTISFLEKRAINSAHKHGITIKHIPIDWYSDDNYQILLDNTVYKVQNELKYSNNIVLIGASAGGSLAINTWSRLDNKNIKVVTICSRINETRLSRWDFRSLERMAHKGTKKYSKLFYESVMYCSNQSLSVVGDLSLQSIISINQLADEIVPKRTTLRPDIKHYTITSIGHHFGIYHGLLQIHRIVRRLPKNI